MAAKKKATKKSGKDLSPKAKAQEIANLQALIEHGYQPIAAAKQVALDKKKERLPTAILIKRQEQLNREVMRRAKESGNTR